MATAKTWRARMGLVGALFEAVFWVAMGSFLGILAVDGDPLNFLQLALVTAILWHSDLRVSWIAVVGGLVVLAVLASAVGKVVGVWRALG